MAYPVEVLKGDVAQVQHPDARFGSGRLLWEGLVLTAAHTLRDAAGRAVIEGWQVRLERDRPASGRWAFAAGNKVVWQDQALDLALIAVSGRAPLLRTRIARLTTNAELPVQMYGYPGASRPAEGAARRLSRADGGLTNPDDPAELKLGVKSSDVPDDPRDDATGWPGMSGGAAFLADWSDPTSLWVYGAAKHVPAQFRGQLRVAGLAAAWEDQAFLDVLQAYAPGTPPPEDPTGAAAPPVHGQLPLPEDAADLAVRLFDRKTQSELFRNRVIGIESGADAPPGDLVVCGGLDDVPLHFQNRLQHELSESFGGEIVRIEWPAGERPAVAQFVVRKQLFDLLKAWVEAPGPFRGYADARMLREALPAEGAVRWFWLKIPDAGACSAETAAQIGALRKIWLDATAGIAGGPGGGALACGMVFALHGVSAVPPALAPVLGGLPTIVLGDCTRDELEAWPVSWQERLRRRARGPGALPQDARARSASALEGWVRQVAARPDFAAGFPLRKLLRAMLHDAAETKYPTDFD